MRWEHLTPPEFKRLVKETRTCILPIGSLERHGDHLPYGTDGIVAHTIACMAAEIEPCVVFPAYWFGQVHEAACFAGTINFPPAFLLQMLEHVLNQIAQNGFNKIIILSGHGGNSHFLDYFAMSHLDTKQDYTLYVINPHSVVEDRTALEGVFESERQGHACESETSMLMACRPGITKLEYCPADEPIEPKNLMKDLKGIHSGFWWYALYDENVVGTPSLATEEKGQKVLDVVIPAVAKAIAKIKDDKVVPAMQVEFINRLEKIKDAEWDDIY